MNVSEITNERLKDMLVRDIRYCTYGEVVALAQAELDRRGKVEKELQDCLDIAVEALRSYCQNPMCPCTAQTAQQEIRALLAKKQ